jgi:hypothetical protein
MTPPTSCERGFESQRGEEINHKGQADPLPTKLAALFANEIESGHLPCKDCSLDRRQGLTNFAPTIRTMAPAGVTRMDLQLADGE